MFKVELKADPWWTKLAFMALIYFSENVLKHQSLLNTKPAPGLHFKINTSPSHYIIELWRSCLKDHSVRLEGNY